MYALYSNTSKADGMKNMHQLGMATTYQLAQGV